MSNPKDIEKVGKRVVKDQRLFTMLVGEFRENRAINQPIIDFLNHPLLKSHRLQILYNSNVFKKGYSSGSGRFLRFKDLMVADRVIALGKSEISNNELNEAFYKSHAIILPYLWGTHSGQIELAKDCGCQSVVSDAGFYKEQWNKVISYKVDKNIKVTSKNYKTALSKAANHSSIKPIGKKRSEEMTEIIKEHKIIYRKALGNG
jgi:hypothetical protein